MGWWRHPGRSRPGPGSRFPGEAAAGSLDFRAAGLQRGRGPVGGAGPPYAGGVVGAARLRDEGNSVAAAPWDAGARGSPPPGAALPLADPVPPDGATPGAAPVAAPGGVWVLIPARNEADRVAATVRAARAVPGVDGVVVVDDGSRDGTAEEAGAAGARVLRLLRPRGKGGALEAGLELLEGHAPRAVLLLDADLGAGAGRAGALLEHLGPQGADMAVGALPSRPGKGGLGLVRRLAAWGIRLLAGWRLAAPLSGQRAIRWPALARLRPLEPGFGVEVGLALAAARHGLRVVEVELDLEHRSTGRDLAGFLHRGRQGWAVLRALARAGVGLRRRNP
ncbi:MAG: glycosyltransferase [Firmicutes bacterium]|nr:glycosyltransferase [Bacillota bacterium]